jgi:hypothetical protein
MALISTVGGARQRRRAPLEFQEAVELHFRKSGRHASIVWIPEPVCQWQVRITLRADDPVCEPIRREKQKKNPLRR